MCFQIRRDTGLWYSVEYLWYSVEYSSYSVEYSSFAVGPEADKYRLSVSGYSGDAGNAMMAAVHVKRIVNGMQFSSADQDNDLNGMKQCMGGTAGWWFNNCARSLLNNDKHGVWNAVTDEPIHDVEFARMMIKLD